MTGMLLTLEGIDGSGKGTQTSLLIEALEYKGYSTRKYSFPAYEHTFYGKEIGAFLRGEFGSFESVHPKLAAMLFACDRLEQKPHMLKDLEDGHVVVCDRYVESNAAHQCAKLPTEERAQFVEWVEQLEYEVHLLPRPDMTLFLDLPLKFSKELVLKKKQRAYTTDKEDIHEAQHGYLEVVYEMYKTLKASRNWSVIPCTDEGSLRNVESIHNSILNLVESKLTQD